jgi:hypothetical protein
MAQPVTTARRRGPFRRLFVDEHGDVRSNLILVAVAAMAMLTALGTFIALVAAGAGEVDVLGAWVVGILLLVKIPALAILWWALGRHVEKPGETRWDSREVSRILASLEEQARLSVGRPDAPLRIAHLSREAWFVADRARDIDKPDAVAAALRIESLSAGVKEKRAPGAGGPPAEDG